MQLVRRQVDTYYKMAEISDRWEDRMRSPSASESDDDTAMADDEGPNDDGDDPDDFPGMDEEDEQTEVPHPRGPAFEEVVQLANVYHGLRQLSCGES